MDTIGENKKLNIDKDLGTGSILPSKMIEIKKNVFHEY
jgi:hypothetical protein